MHKIATKIYGTQVLWRVPCHCTQLCQQEQRQSTHTQTRRDLSAYVRLFDSVHVRRIVRAKYLHIGIIAKICTYARSAGSLRINVQPHCILVAACFCPVQRVLSLGSTQHTMYARIVPNEIPKWFMIWLTDWHTFMLCVLPTTAVAQNLMLLYSILFSAFFVSFFCGRFFCCCTLYLCCSVLRTSCGPVSVCDLLFPIYIYIVRRTS